MTSIHFMVGQALEGGYQARSVGHDIFTEADTLLGLHQRLRDAVRCHFEPEQAPILIHLHITCEEVLTI
jgi:hypothetical protein